jgi:hypothetical protein
MFIHISFYITVCQIIQKCKSANDFFAELCYFNLDIAKRYKLFTPI